MPETRTPVDDVPPSPDAAGRYRTGDVIGRGGRSTVYAAHDVLLDREVAIKVLSASGASSSDLRMQQAEARLAARVNHPALTILFDAGVAGGGPGDRLFLVMERVSGPDLREHLIEHGPLSPAQVAGLGLDLTEGLQHLHAHGFLHRDIKPANVLLTSGVLGPRGCAKLSDFGISSAIGATESGEVTSGTAAYLSPEQVEGFDPTTASDVYALGLVLLESLTGRRAYPGRVEETALARLRREPDVPEGLPVPLALILRQMTALQPAARPTLDEVAVVFQTAVVSALVQEGRVAPDALLVAEQQRLDAVHRYNILDTPPDEAFDRITVLACRLLDVPVGFISIVDAEREWFKSRIGFDVPELDRDVSLCSVTVSTGESLTIDDVQTAHAFAHNPVVRADPALHAFAAVPLRTHDDHVIGTLCVFDRRRRTFTRPEVDDLAQLAALVMRELELRLAGRRMAFQR